MLSERPLTPNIRTSDGKERSKGSNEEKDRQERHDRYKCGREDEESKRGESQRIL